MGGRAGTDWQGCLYPSPSVPAPNLRGWESWLLSFQGSLTLWKELGLGVREPAVTFQAKLHHCSGCPEPQLTGE